MQEGERRIRNIQAILVSCGKGYSPRQRAQEQQPDPVPSSNNNVSIKSVAPSNLGSLDELSERGGSESADGESKQATTAERQQTRTGETGGTRQTQSSGSPARARACNPGASSAEVSTRQSNRKEEVPGTRRKVQGNIGTAPGHTKNSSVLASTSSVSGSSVVSGGSYQKGDWVFILPKS